MVLAASLTCILCRINSEMDRRKRNFKFSKDETFEYLIKSGTSTSTDKNKIKYKDCCKEENKNENIRGRKRRRIIGW